MNFRSQVLAKYQVQAGDVIQLFPNAKKQAPVKPAPKKKSDPEGDKKLVLQLQKLIHAEHVDGCGQTSCSINFAAECGYYYWAIEEFAGSGAASDEFESLYAQLSPDFFKEAEKERKLLCKEPHTKCQHCNALNWGGNVSNCDSCGKPLGGGAA
jgi:hypothetical protein